MDSLRSLAHRLKIPERTLRRAAAEGLVHGERTSPRRFRVSLSEEEYLRRHWPILQDLRAALRTEPGARLAVLYGSMARGTATPRSDVDLMVDSPRYDVARLADLSGRLTRRTGRDVQVVHLVDATRSPVLMSQILEGGRVLVDRDARWEALKAEEESWRRRAGRASSSLEEAIGTLDSTLRR